MKHAYLLILFAVLYSCAPTKPVAKMNYPKPFEFELIDTVHDVKNDIYVRAHQWISKSYGSAKVVIDMQDKEAGKLIGKANMPVKMYIGTMYGKFDYTAYVSYIISIDVKDGKYRCVVSDFNHSSTTVHFSNNTSVPGKSYGDLNQDMVTYISSATNKPVEDKQYYSVKNQVMTQAQAILKDLKEKMHIRDKDF